MNVGEKNYYDILGVPSNCSIEEIQQRYAQVKKAYSSDGIALYSLMGKDECSQMLTEIDEAYSVLSVVQKRLDYDRAHGLNKNVASYSRPNLSCIPEDSPVSKDDISLTPFSSTFNPEPLDTRNNKGSHSIVKIVANNKYSLTYDEDPAFEQELEQTSEFTGELLQKIRDYKNVDIQRMAEMTKVSKTHLKNIEAEEVSKLPALVYIRGFVYQYAKCLKLNPEIVANSYLNRIKRLKEA